MDDLTPELRDLYLRLTNHDKTAAIVAHHIHFHKQRKEIALYLIKIGLTGEYLFEFFQINCKGNPIIFFGRILKAMLRVNTAPKLLKGVNFR